MLIVGLIFPIDESEWISPILIHSKTYTKYIQVCVDCHSLKATCVDDPFPMPLSDEVIDQVAGNKYRSFTDGFLGYH